SDTALPLPPPPLSSLRSHGALLTCLCHHLLSLCASSAANHPYACVVPPGHASNTANHPYSCVVPSQHASDTTNHPYGCLVPSQNASDTTYHPYACVVPSRHASNTANHSAHDTHLPGPQDETTIQPPISSLTNPYASAPVACSPYTHAEPSRYASDTTLNPPYSSAPRPLAILTLPYYIHCVRWLVGAHNQSKQGNMLSGLLCQQDLRGNWSVYSQCCG
ncbi:hypothetical protein O181_128945, partial [Austropuccinia psidii MF-1]|nr:hypothetical protein [Austropuccinia psidii MF-1]